jgi:hypothetical protein
MRSCLLITGQGWRAYFAGKVGVVEPEQGSGLSLVIAQPLYRYYLSTTAPIIERQRIIDEAAK